MCQAPGDGSWYWDIVQEEKEEGGEEAVLGLLWDCQ